MKKILLVFFVLCANITNSQTLEQKENIKKWFNNYGICKCITQAYWLKDIKIEDKSVFFWTKKIPISSNNIENFEDNINAYIKKNISENNLILKNCILITEDKKFREMINEFIKSDKVLQLNKYKISE